MECGMMEIKVRMAIEKSPDLLVVFFFQDTAGTVNDPTAGPDQCSGFFQDSILHMRKFFHRLWCNPVSNLAAPGHDAGV